MFGEEAILDRQRLRSRHVVTPAGVLDRIVEIGNGRILSLTDAADVPNVGEADLGEAMPVIAQLGLPLLVHAELPAVLEAAARDRRVAHGDPTRHETWLASRPPRAEIEAIALVIRLAHE